jgi:hypothetical protein
VFILEEAGHWHGKKDMASMLMQLAKRLPR